MSLSKAETAKADIAAELELISSDNGFRTSPERVLKTVRSRDQISEFPEVGVVFPSLQIKPIGQVFESFDELINVLVRMTQRCPGSPDEDSPEVRKAVEDARSDLLKAWARMATKYYSTQERWIVASGCKVTPWIDRGGGDTVVVSDLTFSIMIFSEGATFQ